MSIYTPLMMMNTQLLQLHTIPKEEKWVWIDMEALDLINNE